jgi:hypothetical protein
LPVEGFPISPGGIWLVAAEDWLAALGQYVFERVQFRWDVIGFETDAETRRRNAYAATG